MEKKKKFRLFPRYSDYLMVTTTILLILFGSLMVVSAEMGETSADLSLIGSSLMKQVLYIVAGLFGLIVFSNFRITKLRLPVIQAGYWIILGMLLSTRLFGTVGGAYGWIKLGPVSIQPSEFAKLYVIILGAHLFGNDHGKKNFEVARQYFCAFLIYVAIVLVYQHDLGSAFVIGVIGYCICLIATYKEIRKWQTLGVYIVIGAVIGAIILLSSIGTNILSHYDDHYQIMRFLASANPFAYQYDSGYHLIMSLVSFATGGWFGLGYGKSIHKYMNFPNPSTDFILPVIVEELGFVFGFMPIIIAYSIILIKLVRHSLKCPNIRGKIVILGTFLYFATHFILNVGGVAGFIPLTGVPLLLLSAGGSAIMSCMSAIGMANCEIANYRKKKAEVR